MTKEQQTAERMRRTAKKENKELALHTGNSPDNYIDEKTLNSITSFKGQDKVHADKLVVRTLLNMIRNGKDESIKLKAIDRYQKLTQNSQLLIKSGNTIAAIETNSDQPTTLNLDLRSHITSDEPLDDLEVTSRDLVKEKNDKDYEDADFEIIE